MAARILFDGASPKTQSVEAVKSLLSWRGRGSDPLPEFVELAGSVRLTLSSKGDCYYTTTPTDCSCKARTFNPAAQCKHMKALLATQKGTADQPEYARRAHVLNSLQAEREANTVGPIEIVSSKGSYVASKKRTTFLVREVDATGQEIRRFDVWDQKTDKGYVWSCSCGQKDCRHITKAKAVFFSEKKAKASPLPEPGKRLARLPTDSIRPGKSEGWAGGMNGPVDPAELRVVA